MIFKYTLEIELAPVEEIEWVATEDMNVDINSQQIIKGITVATVSMYGGYRVDTGQCGGEVLNEYFEKWQEFSFHNVEFNGDFTSIIAESAITTYTLNENTGTLDVISDIKFIMS